MENGLSSAPRASHDSSSLFALQAVATTLENRRLACRSGDATGISIPFGHSCAIITVDNGHSDLVYVLRLLSRLTPAG